MISSLYRILGRKHQQLDSSIRSLSVVNLNSVVQKQSVASAAFTNFQDSKNFSNSNRASITRINRLQYLRQYPTLCVNADGSTFTIRYQDPRRIIKLPVDLGSLSDSARNARLERRKQKTKVKLEEDFEDEKFDAKKYLKFVKK